MPRGSISVGRFGICIHASSGDRFSMESAGICGRRKSGAGTDHGDYRNLWTFVAGCGVQRSYGMGDPALHRASSNPESSSWRGATVVLIFIAIAGPRLVPQAPADHVAHLVQTNFPVAMNYPSAWMQTHAAEMDRLETHEHRGSSKISGLGGLAGSPCPVFLARRPILGCAPCASHAERAMDFWLA